LYPSIKIIVTRDSSSGRETVFSLSLSLPFAADDDADKNINLYARRAILNKLIIREFDIARNDEEYGRRKRKERDIEVINYNEKYIEFPFLI
jgi:hypothetical protein